MVRRIFNKTLLQVVGISAGGMGLLYLLSGDESLLIFLAECLAGLVVVWVVWLLVSALVSLFGNIYE
jgi:hypothetical protein